jgi:hypothetical protein
MFWEQSNLRYQIIAPSDLVGNRERPISVSRLHGKNGPKVLDKPFAKCVV